MAAQLSIVVIMAIIAVVVVGMASYSIGLRDGEADRHSGIGKISDMELLFMQDSERNVAVYTLLESLPAPVVVCDAYGATLFTSRHLDSTIWEDGRLVDPEILGMLSVVSDSGTSRTRRMSPDDGDTWYAVTVASVGDGLFSVTFLDVTDQVTFERTRRDFVTNVSHELKTPAGAISLMAETITDCADDPEAVKHFSERISQESARMSELIAKLIELQKTQVIVPDGSLKPIVVSDVVTSAADELEAQIANKSITLSLNLDPHVTARIQADALRSAVKNLIENAVRYSNTRGRVGVTVDCDDGGARIRVVDNGIGIPIADQKRIFERFYRVDRGRSRDTGGTGVGLAIVKNVVEEAGGTVSVWSRPSEGATFTIQLPPVISDSEAVEAAAEAR
ncbi:sensor histidine kinase [Pseudoscardovia suis]|uniref:Sensor-like histidine kinase SenX3 n=1 Tax=Pseudoscardovia suis TaxID=987063 RepID=A0A261EV77_9BIFI|nr:ATP-binding protein [Pseudoscardovia suis]OZG50556.1 histidine kinase [Pseudoscardovia suis]PJJ62460.1 two-component system sensor histidine kinase SenX3 [Pseudoscardovia suis]